MKISGKFILKVAGTLTVISLVVAALLGLVDNVTADKIAEIDAANTREAMSAVVPEGSEFTDKLEISQEVLDAAAAQGGKITELYGVKNAGADAGYVMKISASGSQGTIVMMVGVDANKAITGISVVSHSETSGIGTKVVGNEPNTAGVPVLDQFQGMSGAGSLVVGKTITAISGATVSTKGITMGANAALAAAEVLG
jgi:electron transport complex protein RnfG